MRKAFGAFLSLGIVTGVCFFFYQEFQKNIGTLAAANISLKGGGIISSLLATIAAYLLVTYAWRYTLLSLLPGKQLSFEESIPAVNIPSLTKYLPGKVWSYAIQMYWLGRSGFSKAGVLYANLLNVFISILISAIIGCVFFIFEPGFLSSDVAQAFTAVLLIFDICFVTMNSWIIGIGIKLVNRIFKKDVTFLRTPWQLLVNLQILYLLIYSFFGLGAYFLCEGMGIPVQPGLLFPIISGVALADSIGFLVFLVPGGFGVREGVMYFILKDVSSEQLALLLPIANRAVVMTAEIMLGLFALYLLKRMTGLSVRNLGRLSRNEPLHSD